jgi:hypothetical protein
MSAAPTPPRTPRAQTLRPPARSNLQPLARKKTTSELFTTVGPARNPHGQGGAPANTKPSRGWLEQSYRRSPSLKFDSASVCWPDQSYHRAAIGVDPNVPGSQTISVSRLDLKLTAIPAVPLKVPKNSHRNSTRQEPKNCFATRGCFCTRTSRSDRWPGTGGERRDVGQRPEKAARARPPGNGRSGRCILHLMSLRRSCSACRRHAGRGAGDPAWRGPNAAYYLVLDAATPCRARAAAKGLCRSDSKAAYW